MNPADAVLREIEQMGARAFIPSIGPVKAKILAKVVRDAKPKRILEVGVLYGYSSIMMAKNAPPGVEIIAVEKNPEHVQISKRNVKRAEMDDLITVVEGDGTAVLKKLSGKFDLVFLDAEKSEYLAYLKAVEKNLHQGSIIVADNVGIFKDEMEDYLDYVRKKGPY